MLTFGCWRRARFTESSDLACRLAAREVDRLSRCGRRKRCVGRNPRCCIRYGSTLPRSASAIRRAGEVRRRRVDRFVEKCGTRRNHRGILGSRACHSIGLSFLRRIHHDDDSEHRHSHDQRRKSQRVSVEALCHRRCWPERRFSVIVFDGSLASRLWEKGESH